ncbi:FRG domain-containing protein [Ensifer sp. 2YAB10]|uniref:FRG domain-containing protein n=1 Tax=unclassified Ensifer TaxID=2633371 RepID=UPI003F92A910
MTTGGKSGAASKRVTVPPPAPKVESVHQFVKLIMETKLNGADPTAFRGQKNFSWKGLAPIFRPGERLVEHEREMVRELISVHPQEFQQDSTMFDRLVRMQHYGLPTRLLDVTLNPLVALFFAAQDYFDETKKDGKITKTPKDGKVIIYRVPDDRSKYYDSDTVACVANLANLPYSEKKAIQKFGEMQTGPFNGKPELKNLLHYIELERPMFQGRIEPISLYRPIFVRPKNNNRRIIAQAGAFIVYGLEATGDSRPYDTTIRQKAIRVPADKKPEIREQLGRLGIDASVLFPELDKAADIIAARYRKRAEDFLDLI